MNATSIYILVTIFGYLIGSFSFAIFVSKKLEGDDIRKYGSGNAGAANMVRTMGIKAGIMTLAGDALKGALAAYIGMKMGQQLGAPAIIYGINWCAALGGFGAYLGHCLPLYHDFKGGKGVATAAGAFLVLDGNVFLLFLLFWALTIALTRLVSLGAIVGAWSYPFGVVILRILSLSRYGIMDMQNFTKAFMAIDLPYFILGLVFAIAITYFHRGNISRMLKGTEPKLDFKKHEKEEKYG